MNANRHKLLLIAVFIFLFTSIDTYGWEMYVSNEQSNSITVHDQTGALINTITDLSISEARGMAFRANGNLYVACGSSKIVIIDNNQTVIDSINIPLQGGGLAIGCNNHLYVGLTNSPNNIVQEYDENDNFVRSFSGSLNPFKPDVMNIGPNGNLFVDSYGLVKFDLSGNLIKYLPNDSNYTYGLGVVAGPDGLLYVVRHNHVTSQSDMIGINPSTFEIEKSFSLGSERFIYGITIDPESHHFFITVFSSGIIEEYEFTGEFVGSFISGLSGPVDITIKSNIDSDVDDMFDSCDNCPNHPNGSALGTCIHGTIGETCTSNEECDIAGGDGFCSMNQEDNYPPQGNGIGDACECEGDFDRNGAVDADDVTKFLEDFGRSQFFNPCP